MANQFVSAATAVQSPRDIMNQVNHDLIAARIAKRAFHKRIQKTLNNLPFDRLNDDQVETLARLRTEFNSEGLARKLTQVEIDALNAATREVK